MTDTNHTDTHTDATGTSTDQTPVDPADTGRRAMLRRVALGSAGAAAGMVLLGRTAHAGDNNDPTEINGNAVELGETNTSDAPTIVDYTGTDALTEGPSLFSAGGEPPAVDAPYPAGVGGYGDDLVPNGVHGSTSNGAGFGVVAANLAAAPDEAADPMPEAAAALAVASANGPQIKFVQLDGAVAGPTPGTHVPGELYVDAEGTLWFTVPVPAVGGGDPGVRFVKLAGAQTAGAFHALPIAKRIYDSREVATPVKLAEGESVDIDLTKDFEGADSGFIVGSRLAQVNLTITGTEELGFVQLHATGVDPADVKTSNINWFQTGTTVANLTGVPVSATGSITARVLSDTADTLTARTHVIVDLVGFYL